MIKNETANSYKTGGMIPTVLLVRNVREQKRYVCFSVLVTAAVGVTVLCMNTLQ
jgi:hypothetical protein